MLYNGHAAMQVDSGRLPIPRNMAMAHTGSPRVDIGLVLVNVILL